MPYPTTIFQNSIARELQQIFPPDIPIETEWRAIPNIPNLYSPRIDVVVGPFSMTRGGNQIQAYNDLIDHSEVFLTQLINYHEINVVEYGSRDQQVQTARQEPNIDDLRNYNENARCFLAIEVENRVSRKHLLGGAINASALGRVGVLIGWDDEKVRAMIKLQSYWNFLGSVGKNTFDTQNLLVLSKEQMAEVLNINLENLNA